MTALTQGNMEYHQEVKPVAGSFSLEHDVEER